MATSVAPDTCPKLPSVGTMPRTNPTTIDAHTTPTMLSMPPSSATTKAGRTLSASVYGVK